MNETNPWDRLLQILSTMKVGKNIMIGAFIAEFGNIPDEYKSRIESYKEL